MMNNIAIFASGTGTNALKILEHKALHPLVKLIVCNKPNAGVLNIAANYNIPTLIVEREQFFKQDAYLLKLKEYKIDWIVLAGFLWKVPEVLVKAYPNKIINIHPALLPKYGGKGMYGHFVHEAIHANKEKETGITIHYVDELYDNGSIIFQATCAVTENDSPDTIAKKVQVLEHKHFAETLAKIIL